MTTVALGSSSGAAKLRAAATPATMATTTGSGTGTVRPTEQGRSDTVLDDRSTRNETLDDGDFCNGLDNNAPIPLQMSEQAPEVAVVTRTTSTTTLHDSNNASHHEAPNMDDSTATTTATTDTATTMSAAVVVVVVDRPTNHSLDLFQSNNCTASTSPQESHDNDSLDFSVDNVALPSSSTAAASRATFKSSDEVWTEDDDDDIDVEHGGSPNSNVNGLQPFLPLNHDNGEIEGEETKFYKRTLGVTGLWEYYEVNGVEQALLERFEAENDEYEYDMDKDKTEVTKVAEAVTALDLDAEALQEAAGAGAGAAVAANGPTMAVMAPKPLQLALSEEFVSAQIVYDGNGERASTTMVPLPMQAVEGEQADLKAWKSGGSSSSSLKDNVDATLQDRRRTRQYVACAMMVTIVASIAAVSTIVVCSGYRQCFANRPGALASFDETVAPAPIPVSLLVAEQVCDYIGNITLTNQTFTVSVAVANDARTTTPEELAVQRLLQTNYINEPPDTPALQFRWLQRYALACLLATALPGSSFDNRTLDGDECEWVGIECDEMDVGASVGVQNVSVKVNLPSFELTGSIPADLGLLSTLTHVDLSFNEMTGSLPSSIGRWTDLEYFSAAANELNGTLPESMSQWSNLAHFDIGPNLITGTLPSWIGQWTALQFFSVALNSFTGSLPEDIGRWTDLQTFNVYANFVLEGSLPNSIAAWTDLDFLDAAWNQLTGSLPSSIGQWTNVTVVSVTRNYLTGTIPESIGRWANIERAYFGNNSFTGSVPATICINRTKEAHEIYVDEGIPCQCC